jgi:hypothetical protein
LPFDRELLERNREPAVSMTVQNQLSHVRLHLGGKSRDQDAYG